MANHQKSPHEQHLHLDYDYKRSRLKRRAIFAAPAAALLASVVGGTLYATSTESRAPITRPDCRLNDDMSIEHYKKRIDDIYKSKHNDGDSDTRTVYSSDGMLKVKVIGLDTTEKAAIAPLTQSVTDVLSYLPSTFVAASGVRIVRLEDISSESASGLYDYTSPHAIILDRVILNDSTDTTVMNAPAHQYDRALIHDISVHELGHAAVTNLCGTPIPPVEFSNANNLAKYSPQADRPNKYYGYVSDYASTNSSEDVAETVEAIMGTPSLSGAVGTLQYELEDHNLVLREKTAVVLAMLDKLEPGAGNDALDALTTAREQSIKERYGFYPAP